MVEPGSDEQRLLLKQVASDVVSKFPKTYWRQKDDTAEFPIEFWAEAAKQGWFGIRVPKEYGGADLGMIDAITLGHEIAHAGTGFTGSSLLLSTAIMTSEALNRHATSVLKELLLPKLARGEIKCAFALTEPNSGVDSLSIKTVAKPSSDHFVLQGQKTWITLGRDSDYMLVAARTSTEQKSKGMSLFIIDTKSKGVNVSPIPSSVLRAGRSSTVFFDDVSVPSENLIGTLNDGWKCLVPILNSERLYTSAITIGTSRLALGEAVAYAKERIVFGQPIGRNQAIQFPLAAAWAKIEAAWLMTREAAKLQDGGIPNMAQANVAAFLAADAGSFTADRALQTYGAAGFHGDNDIRRYWRDLRLSRISPVPEEMMLSFLGHHVLGLPKSY